MTLIRVNPTSVQSYGTEAQNLFDGMHQSLLQLVDEVVAVHYYGPNSVAFKNHCGQMAADFANRLHADMHSITDAVQSATTAIASSLGGAPITITLDAKPITPPSPLVADYVDVDTEALSAMVPVLAQRFTSLDDSLGNNLSSLQATDWQGTAKVNAVDSVSAFTNSARQSCAQAKLELTTYITSQVDSVLSADH